MSIISINLFMTPSIFDTYPVDEEPGFTSRSSSGILTVQEEERTTLELRSACDFTFIDHFSDSFPPLG